MEDSIDDSERLSPLRMEEAEKPEDAKRQQDSGTGQEEQERGEPVAKEGGGIASLAAILPDHGPDPEEATILMSIVHD